MWFEQTFFVFTYEIPGLILAQFVVGSAFAIRTMRNTFDHLPKRPELVARTLGASSGQAFWHVTFPAARRGMVPPPPSRAAASGNLAPSWFLPGQRG